MWGFLLVIGWAITGQVAADGDRYLGANAGSDQPSAALGQAQDSSSGLLQMIDSTAADADPAPPPNSAPLPRAHTDIYGSGSAAPSGASARGDTGRGRCRFAGGVVSGGISIRSPASGRPSLHTGMKLSDPGTSVPTVRCDVRNQ